MGFYTFWTHGLAIEQVPGCFGKGHYFAGIAAAYGHTPVRPWPFGRQYPGAALYAVRGKDWFQVIYFMPCHYPHAGIYYVGWCHATPVRTGHLLHPAHIYHIIYVVERINILLCNGDWVNKRK
jgi:hypothetical protein